MQSSKYKIISIIVSAVLSLLIFITPMIAAAGVVAVPVVAINELFKNIGDFLFGNGDDNTVVNLINQYIKSDEGKQMINSVYKPLINAETETSISLHWLVIPNLLAGIEHIEEDYVKKQITIIKETNNNLEMYINQLRQQEPWKSGFSNVSTTTIVGYINQFSGYLGEEGSIDIGDLKEEEFLYPLKERAIVTSEFGTRTPIQTPNGVTMDMHTGIDLAYAGGDATTCGVPIYASMGGEVVANERTMSQAGANWGAIRFKNLEIWYVHLRDPFPYEVGTKIQKGQFVGYIGSSGLSTACHLHYETRVNNQAVNPRNFLGF